MTSLHPEKISVSRRGLAKAKVDESHRELDFALAELCNKVGRSAQEARRFAFAVSVCVVGGAFIWQFWQAMRTEKKQGA